MPYDFEALDMLADRINKVQGIMPVPFLLENNVYFIVFRDRDMTEPQFLNALTARTGCGLLLDIHNLYANARNHHFDALAFLQEADLTRVVETHIAGGSGFAGTYTDSHSGACPEPVWNLLEYVVPRAPNLRAITFAFHDSYYPILGPEGVREQLTRARTIFARHREPAFESWSLLQPHVLPFAQAATFSVDSICRRWKRIVSWMLFGKRECRLAALSTDRTGLHPSATCFIFRACCSLIASRRG